MTARVRIGTSSDVFDAPEGEDLLEVLQKNGVPIATSCGGVATCGLCRITIIRGKESLSTIRSVELEHLGNVAKVIGLRLACQSKVCGDGEIVVDVPVVEDVEERKRRKAERIRLERRAPPATTPNENGVIEWRPRAKPSK
ncbi:MAG: 2Fe-2S iron-sulfur cluster-binding protein [Polyangiaceae bacterium]